MTNSDIVEQLRLVSATLMGRKEVDGISVNAVTAEAADTILTLKAENDALREVLQTILSFSDSEMEDGDGARRVARAALSGSPEG